jgi:hypothetical protein
VRYKPVCGDTRRDHHPRPETSWRWRDTRRQPLLRTVNPSTGFWSFLTISAVVAAAVGLEVGYRLFTANDWESAGTTT